MKIIYPILLMFLFSCGPSKMELDEQKKIAQEKELQDFKNSNEYKEYLKNKLLNVQISKEVREKAEEQIISSKNIYFDKKIISPADERISLYSFDGCEYIGNYCLASTNEAYLTHKGNCKFCHKRDSLMMVSIIKSLVPDMIVRHSHR